MGTGKIVCEVDNRTGFKNVGFPLPIFSQTILNDSEQLIEFPFFWNTMHVLQFRIKLERVSGSKGYKDVISLVSE